MIDIKKNNFSNYNIGINAKTLFILSTSGSQSSIEKHNKALKSIGVNIIYFTFNREISAQAYVNLLRSPIIRAGAVTGQGLKSKIMQFLDEIDELAKSIGVVNTIVNKNGKLFGYNTDAFGFDTAIRKHLNSSGHKIKKAIIYGCGGVSGVASYVLKNMGIAVTMTGRNQKKVDFKMCDLNLSKIKGPYDLVVNATPISSAAIKEAVGFSEILQDSKMVFDHNMPEKDGKINYLQNYCNNNKIYFIPGKDMYVPQMIKQWKLFLDGVLDNDGNPMTVTEDDIIKFWKLKDTR